MGASQSIHVSQVRWCGAGTDVLAGDAAPIPGSKGSAKWPVCFLAAELSEDSISRAVRANRRKAVPLMMRSNVRLAAFASVRSIWGEAPCLVSASSVRLFITEKGGEENIPGLIWLMPQPLNLRLLYSWGLDLRQILRVCLIPPHCGNVGAFLA